MNTANHPRADRALDLIRPLAGEVVTPFIRWVCAALAIGYAFLGYQPLTDPTAAALDRPIFSGVFGLADPRAWGIAFIAVAVLLAITAITGRAGLYLAALVGATATLAAWASTIIYTALTVPDATLTVTAVGLYVIDFTAIIGLAMSPRQLANHEPVAHLDLGLDRDDNVVELRQREAVAL